MKSLYIVDAVNILFRSYFAIRGMTNPKGESTNALFGFIRTIQKILKDFSATHFVAVFDGPQSKESRKKIYEEYKSHRTGMPEDLFPQLEWAIQFCDYAGIPHLEVPGVEADDTIGSIARWAEKKGVEVFICSSDKDLCQLVTPYIRVLHLHKDNLLIGEKEVKEIYGVRPDQIVDLLALMGDASDNIPGLEGFGMKTAAALLEKMGTLDHILAHPDEVPGAKKQEIVRQGKEVALMSRELARIDINIDFPKTEEFFALKKPDLENLKVLYHQMHFLSLLKELGGEVAPTPIQREGNYQLINDEAALSKLLHQLAQAKEICVDTETTDVRPMLARLVGVGFCVEPHLAWYVPLNGNIPRHKVLEMVKPLLESKQICFYGHNIKYDLHVLHNEGIHLQNISFDTILASYLIAPQNQRHNLNELSLTKFGKVKIPIDQLIGKGKKQIGMADVPLEKISEYCCEDADYTCQLKALFEKELKAEELDEIFETIELPLLPVLARMEREGIYLDVDKLKKMSVELKEQLHTLEQEIFEIAGESFNLSSPKQLSHILFVKMGIQPLKKIATGYSTNAEVLEALQEEAPVVKKILEYRTLQKLCSTYCDALPEAVNPQTGRVHCTFNQFVAATGRLSSQDPNLQNIPIRTEEGRKIRTAFKPQAPGWSFLSADYSQVELRILAHLSEDPALLKAFNEGEDVHAYTASLVYGIPLEEVTPEMRHAAKAVNFGIIYGQQAYGLSESLGIEYKEASAFIETYFKRYKKVKEFLDFCKDAAQKTGKAVTLTGRQRPIPEIHSQNGQIRAAAERLAINTPIQGSAADLIKLAMIQIDGLLMKEPNLGKMILQIHDELLFEVPDFQIEKLSSLVKKTMEGAFALTVPLVVDISIGKNWGEC